MGTFGLPWNFADATFQFQAAGDGLAFNYVHRPLSQQSFVAWSPPGAMTTQSTMYHQAVNNVAAGDNALLTGTAINSLLPWNASYLVWQPPITSTVAKTLKGAAGDTGISLIPYLPIIIALPSPLPNSWAFILNYGAAEDADFYLF